MKIYKNGINWLIEDQLDYNLVDSIRNVLNNNLNNFLKLKKNYSIIGKNSEQYWIEKKESNLYFNNKEFEKLKKDYKNEIFKKLKRSELLCEDVNVLNINNKNCWTVIGEENSFHMAHYHNGGDSNGISTILYLNVPKTNEEKRPQNNIFLVMNSDSQNAIYHRNSPVININPKVGKLLIFPEWIVHGTYPQSKGIRQTFNVDYYFTNAIAPDFKYN